MTVEVYLGLGSNLEDPVAQIRTAIEALQQIPETTLVSSSSLYQSPPLTLPDSKSSEPQPDYINAVAKVATNLSPHQLLDQCQAIENRQGRVRGPERWAARTLDLDIIYFGDEIIDDDRLTIPHSGLVERNFVLYPLSEIAPDLVLPLHGPIGYLLEQCEQGDLRRLQSV